MASYIEISRCNLIPLSLSSLCACHSRRPSSSSLKTLILARSNSSNLRLSLLFDGSRRVFRVPRGISVNNPRVITAVAGTEPDRLDEGETKEVDSASELQQKAGQLKKRIVFGLGIGISCGGVVLAGGWVFTVAIAAAVFVGSREYFELVRSRGIAAGMTPPPRYLSRFCSVICTLIPILTLYFGLDVSVTSAAFVVAMTLLLQRGNPRFAQLSSTMFGLFYCGYLPSFWVKLRCGLAAPALNSRVVTGWPLLLGGQTLWTVGLVATLISISSIIAADTCAFAGGKAFGRTPLTNISPKKTWEGAAAGLAGCIATSVILSRILSWPTSFLSAIAFGVLNFFGSLFGDLTESMIKRDAGVKDSGSLIPGHDAITLTQEPPPTSKPPPPPPPPPPSHCRFLLRRHGRSDGVQHIVDLHRRPHPPISFADLHRRPSPLISSSALISSDLWTARQGRQLHIYGCTCLLLRQNFATTLWSLIWNSHEKG